MKRKRQILRRMFHEKNKSILKSSLFFMLLSIGKISFCQLQELLKVPFHSFRHTGLVRKTEKWKYKLQLIYLL